MFRFGGHVNALCIVEQQFIGAPAVEFCGLDIVSDSSSNQKHYQKRTRLVLKEVDAQAEEAHFAILDKMVGELDSMNREPR